MKLALFFIINSIIGCLYYAIKFKEINLAILILSPLFGFIFLFMFVFDLLEELSYITLWKGK